MTCKMIVLASLVGMAEISDASAQHTDCALYIDRDHLNKGALTPAAERGGFSERMAQLLGGRQSEAVAGARNENLQESNAMTLGLKTRASPLAQFTSVTDLDICPNGPEFSAL